MKIAVVGGGITGSVVASELAETFHGGNSGSGEVILFDQGRRGPGGRASHRSVIKKEKKHSAKAITGRYNQQGKDDCDNDDSTVLENDEEEFLVLPDDDIASDESAFQFDHGCQFFRADTPKMQHLVEGWLQKGWVKPWKARFGSLPQTDKENCKGEDMLKNGNDDGPIDFFGLPPPANNGNRNSKVDVYIGVGGMHLLPRRILESSKAVVHRGSRVSGVTLVQTAVGGNSNSNSSDEQQQHQERQQQQNQQLADKNSKHNQTNEWQLTVTIGTAAFHDTDESEAELELQRAKEVAESSSGSDEPPHPPMNDVAAAKTRVVVHRGFDAVVFTDISSSSDSWHRASAGVPPSFTAKLPPKLRLPLFSCMIALETPIRDRLPYDAFSSKPFTNSPLWFAALSDSKPGFPKGRAECWTLISTPSFAVDEIKETTMRDPITGAFRPQEDDYLNAIPGPALRDAFFDLVQPYLGDSQPPRTAYLQAQRWGSGLPIDPERVLPKHIEHVCGTQYASSVEGSLVHTESSSCFQNFVTDDVMGLYYGGDFCSHLNPGFEAAALSGFDLATHILSLQDIEES